MTTKIEPTLYLYYANCKSIGTCLCQHGELLKMIVLLREDIF